MYILSRFARLKGPPTSERMLIKFQSFLTLSVLMVTLTGGSLGQVAPFEVSVAGEGLAHPSQLVPGQHDKTLLWLNHVGVRPVEQAVKIPQLHLADELWTVHENTAKVNHEIKLSDGNKNEADAARVSFTIYDAVTTLERDDDLDGFHQSFTIYFDPDVSTGSANVYGEIFMRQGSSAWLHIHTTSPFPITGNSGSDGIARTFGINGSYPTGHYDFRIDLYQNGVTSLQASRGPQDDPSLNDLPLEGAFEDSPRTFSIYDASSSLIRDRDGDGNHSAFSLYFDPDTSVGVANVFALISLRRGNDSYQLIHNTGIFTITGNSASDAWTGVISLANAYVNAPAGSYDIKIDLYEENVNGLAASRGPEDPSLNDLPLEGESLDVGTGPSFVLTDVSTQLLQDVDADGYYRSFHVEADPDMSSGSANVYIGMYMRRGNGSYQLLYTSPSFHISGSNQDGWSANFTLTGNAPPDAYDLRIELFEASTAVLKASMGPDENSRLNNLLLEDTSNDQPPIGSLRVLIEPAAAIQAGAQWRLDGGSWRDSGTTLSSINSGSHTLSFRSVSGWGSPSSRNVTIQNGSTLTETGVYQPQLGGITVLLQPQQVISAGRWKLDNGNWQNSGDSLANIAVGNHQISFKDATDWESPPSQQVTINAGQITQVEGTYNRKNGIIRVTFTSNRVAAAGARWRVDGGAWLESGFAQGGLSLGSHTISFKSVATWATPPDQTVVTESNRTTSLELNYDDIEAPLAFIRAPTGLPHFETEQSTIIVSGIANDNDTLERLYWLRNGVRMGAVAGREHWKIDPVQLLPGSNEITVVAIDKSGKEARATIVIVFGADTKRPEVRITTPTTEESYTTERANVLLAGIALDNIGVTRVHWTNSRGGQGEAFGTETWQTETIALARGENIISVFASDSVGLEGVTRLTVIYDAGDEIAPQISITSPAQAVLETNASSLSVSGSSSDNNSVFQVTWKNDKGDSGVAQGRESWSVINIPLYRGNNSLLFTVYDEAGLSAETGLIVTRLTGDSSPPMIAITFPTDQAEWNSPLNRINLSGTVSDDQELDRVEWSTEGNPGKMVDFSNSQFVSDKIPLLKPVTVFTVTAFDKSGNSASDTITVRYFAEDREAPTLRILQPTTADSFRSTTGTVTLSGTATDEHHLAEVQWRTPYASGIATGKEQWSTEPITLQKGKNRFEIIAIDGGDNRTSAFLEVDYIQPNQPPALQNPGLTISHNPAEVLEAIDFSVSVSDPDRDPLVITWDFGDGSSRLNGTSVNHRYQRSGTYTVEITVSDGHNPSLELFQEVEIQPRNQAPRDVVLHLSTNRAQVGQPIVFTSEAFDTNNDPLTYTFDMGNGDRIERVITDSEAEPRLIYAYKTDGDYGVSVFVSDGHGNISSSASQELAITATSMPAVGLQVADRHENFEIFHDRGAGENAIPLTLLICNAGGRAFNFTLVPTVPWLQVNPARGSSSGPEDLVRCEVSFWGSQLLEANAEGYIGEIEIVTNDIPTPPKITIRLGSDYYPAIIRAGKSSETSLTVEMKNFGELGVHGFEGLAIPQDGPVKRMQTFDTSLLIRDLEGQQRVRVRGTNPAQSKTIEAESAPISLSNPGLGYANRFPHVAQINGWWTGLALVNANWKPANMRLEALNFSGSVIATSPIRKLKEGEKQLGDLFHFFPELKERGGEVSALQLFSDMPLVGLELFGTAKSLTGVVAGDNALLSGHIPTPDEGSAWTALTLFNPSTTEPVEVYLEGFDDQGRRLAGATALIEPGEKRAALARRFLGDPAHLSWMRFQANQPIVGFSLWAGSQPQVVNGSALAGGGSLKSVLPLVGSNSRIVGLNPGEKTNHFRLRYYSVTGQLLEESTQIIGPRKSVTLTPRGEGSLELTSKYPAILTSDIIRSRPGGTFLGDSVPGQSRFGHSFVIPHVAMNTTWSTELLLSNVGDTAADIALDGYRADGEYITGKVVKLPAHGSLHQLVSHLIETQFIGQVNYLRIRALPNAKLAGQVIFYTNPGQGELMATVPLIAVP